MAIEKNTKKRKTERGFGKIFFPGLMFEEKKIVDILDDSTL